MNSILFEHLAFEVNTLDEALSLNKSSDAPMYVYGRYSNDFLTKMYMLQAKHNYGYVGLLFAPEEVDKVLRHINIFNRFTFGLIPEKIDKTVYLKIYDFFIFSKLSVSYITWIGSLMLKPNRGDVIKINGQTVNIPVCPECPLKAKGCSKERLFFEIYHPEKEMPSINDFDSFCEIQREFSQKIAQDVGAVTKKEMGVFKVARESIGIRSQFWIDPFMIYG